jgi:6-phosphogluconolactonase/glucosamine-6-phosphate isomerase/deaminase
VMNAKPTFRYIQQEDISIVAGELADIISKQASTNDVLWLLSGGSCIKVAVESRILLGDLSQHKHKINIAMIDERLVDIGNSDSNHQQLIDSGFDFTYTNFMPIIYNYDTNAGVSSYEKYLQKALTRGTKIIGLFGMGIDGHTAGLLPNCTILKSAKLIDHYQGPDYLRASITPKMFDHIDTALLYCVGMNKWPALEIMKSGVYQLPVQLLKNARKLVVYTDYKEKS